MELNKINESKYKRKYYELNKVKLLEASKKYYQLNKNKLSKRRHFLVELKNI